MGNDYKRVDSGYAINVSDFIAGSAEAQAVIAEFVERRNALLDSLSPEERTKEEARLAAEEEAATKICEEDERSHTEAMSAAEQATLERHHEIAADRKATTIGTLTEVGRPYGLSGIAVGRILDQHDLRRRVDVDDDRFLPPLSIALNRFEAASRERWQAFYVKFPPSRRIEPRREVGRPTLRLLRGVVEGFAIHDHFDSRDYWITVKIGPLLKAQARRKP